MLTHPPKPRLALTVGIMGHRPNRLPDGSLPDVISKVEEALTLISQSAQMARERHKPFFSEEPPALILLSALAEGADQIAARSALDKGYSLTAVLPFGAEDYQSDFKETSAKSEYRTLLAKAERICALPGVALRRKPPMKRPA